jgi:hypothetical protein
MGGWMEKESIHLVPPNEGMNDEWKGRRRREHQKGTPFDLIKNSLNLSIIPRRSFRVSTQIPSFLASTIHSHQFPIFAFLNDPLYILGQWDNPIIPHPSPFPLHFSRFVPSLLPNQPPSS